LFRKMKLQNIQMLYFDKYNIIKHVRALPLR